MKKILMTLTLALGAMIAIPAAAQSTASSEQKTECCKEKKACSKEGQKECKKDQKACSKEGQKECKKDQKACAKDGKQCAKAPGKPCRKAEAKEGAKNCCGKDSGKVCSKGSKKGMHKAQPGRRPNGNHRLDAGKSKGMMRHGAKGNPLMKGITLSEEQQQKVNALREKSLAGEKKAEAKSMEELQKLHADFDKEMEKILDKDQLKQYQANKAEMNARRAEMQAKRPKTEKK